METFPHRDHRRPLAIDWAVLGQAQAHYAALGFVDTPVPWVVGEEAYGETLPSDVRPYRTLGGFLVASAEQSFLHSMIEGGTIGRAQATTPCFRDEIHGEWHSPYFMKTELIVGDTNSPAVVEEILACARSFFDTFLATDVIALPDGGLDIVSLRGRIELGSYGARRHGEFKWAYGTGVALPRLSQAVALEAGSP